MKNVYDAAIQAAKEGKRVRVNFLTKSMYINKEWWVVKGVLQRCSELWPDPDTAAITRERVLKNIEEYYQRYKHSIPSEKSDQQRRPYFYAIPCEELSDEDMLYGEPRLVAQARLEVYLLCAVLDGLLTWDEKTMGNWFWQSKEDKDLVILRSWI